jgi:hypothetical protein
MVLLDDHLRAAEPRSNQQGVRVFAQPHQIFALMGLAVGSVLH